MHDDAMRAAAEIPGATFVSLAGHSHISAFYEADDILLPQLARASALLDIGCVAPSVRAIVPITPMWSCA